MPNKTDLMLLRGVARNAEYFPEVDHVLFSASQWRRSGFRSKCVGHAMLHPILPGDEWPSALFPQGSTVPVELSHVHVVAGMRHKGLGRRLMNEVMQYCQRRHWRVVLRIAPYGRGNERLSVTELFEWYQKFGFKIAGRIESVIYMVSTH